MPQFWLTKCIQTSTMCFHTKMYFDFQNVFWLPKCISTSRCIFTHLHPLWEPKVNHFHITMVIWQLNSIQITHFCLKVLYRYIYLIRQGASINSNYDKHFWHHSWLRSKETKECWIFLERDQPSNITVVLNFNNITKGPEFPAKRSFHQHVNVFSILERLVQPVKWILDEKCIFYVNSETHMIIIVIQQSMPTYCQIIPSKMEVSTAMMSYDFKMCLTIINNYDVLKL